MKGGPFFLPEFFTGGSRGSREKTAKPNLCYLLFIGLEFGASPFLGSWDLELSSLGDLCVGVLYTLCPKTSSAKILTRVHPYTYLLPAAEHLGRVFVLLPPEKCFSRSITRTRNPNRNMKTDLRPGFSRRAVGEPPRSPAPPVRLRYTGQEPRLVAQVGQVAPGNVKQISADLGAHLLKHMPEEWEAVPAAPPQPTPSVVAPTKPLSGSKRSRAH
jgi:hypothetical protein